MTTMTQTTGDTGGDNVALAKAAALIRESQCVAVLTGAGVSAESGVPTFRGSDGLWEGHRIDEVATPFAFRENPGLVWRFYNLRRSNLRSVQPNPGHAALAELERRFPGDRERIRRWASQQALDLVRRMVM